MEKENVEAVLVTDPYNQCYLTGFEIITYSRPIFTIVTKHESILIVPGLEEQHAKATAVYDRLLVYYEHPEKAESIDPMQLIERCLGRLNGNKKIGIEFRSMPFGLASYLQANNWELLDITTEMIHQRSVKDDQELEKLRNSCLLASHSIQASLQALKAGMTELEIESIGTQALYQEAPKLFPNSAVMTRGMCPSGIERTVMPHVFSNLKKVEAGDGLIITRISSLDGYKGECERTCFVGEPTEKQRELFNIMLKAQHAALQIVKAGVKASKIDAAARSVIHEAGYGEFAIHRVGHSIGLSLHEAPYFRFDEDFILQEGMAFTVEPGIYVPGIGGFRHSDTIIVTKDGYEMLTNCPRSIDELIF